MPISGRDNNIYKVAILVALACVLQISESLIPHPIPGLRLGLANMISLTALVCLGFRYALEVAILRVVLSSFIMGTFMSPIFILSFSGAVISTLVMGFFYWLSGFHNHFRLSIIGISIIGAFTHNMVQLYFAYLLLIKHSGIFVLLPWLGIGAVATGWVVGVVSGGVIQRLQKGPHQNVLVRFSFDNTSLSLKSYMPGTSPIHLLPAAIKLCAIFVLALSILIFDHFWFYLGIFFFLSAITFISRTPFRFLIGRLRKYASLILVSFLLPLFFNSGTKTMLTIASIEITNEGLSAGGIFAARILFLIIASVLLVRTTSPDELTRGINKILSPLRILGISSQRIAIILSLSWTAVPQLWDVTRSTIINSNLTRARNLRKLLPLLSDLIALLYIKAEPQQAFEKGCYDKDENDQLDTLTGRTIT